jgi:tyrosyl-tRNA synthetase
MVMSLEKIKNEFTVEQEDNKFLMKREIVERIDAADLISLHEDLEKQIKDYNDVLETLHDKKMKFEVLLDIANKIRNEELEKGKKEMREYVSREKVEINYGDESDDEENSVDGD